jgi:ArsR family transcriptional regulator
MEPSNNIIKEDKLEVSSEVLRALTHPLRMQILEFIDRNEMINVNRIYSSLQLEQSITSQHLRILRQAGLVETERRGKFIHYRLRYGKLSSTITAIKNFEQAIAS